MEILVDEENPRYLMGFGGKEHNSEEKMNLMVWCIDEVLEMNETLFCVG